MELDQNEFTITSSNKAFSDRQKQIFDQLSTLEQLNSTKFKRDDSLDSDMDIETPSNISRKRKHSDFKQFRGRESIFKRPEAPISKCLQPRTQPDFKVNPHKWKKYSLEDVTPEEMSNRMNTSTALSFLRELEERKLNSADDDLQSTDNKLIFHKKKPTFNVSVVASTSLSDSSDSPQKPAFKSTVRVMPEYIVGQRDKKKKTFQQKDKSNTRKELKLDHLLEENFEDS